MCMCQPQHLTTQRDMITNLKITFDTCVDINPQTFVHHTTALGVQWGVIARGRESEAMRSSGRPQTADPGTAGEEGVEQLWP